MYRSSKKNAEGNSGRQGAMLCRNPQRLHSVLYFLYGQLEIGMAVHRMW